MKRFETLQYVPEEKSFAKITEEINKQRYSICTTKKTTLPELTSILNSHDM